MVQHYYSCTSSWLRMQLEQRGYTNFSVTQELLSQSVFQGKENITLLTQYQPAMVDHPTQSCPTHLPGASSDCKVSNQKRHLTTDLQ